MDLAKKKFFIVGLQVFPPPIQNRQSSLFPSPPHSSDNSFPILVIAIIGILATAFLLVSYYIFVIKCCLNWHRIDLLGRFSFSRSRRRDDDRLMIYSPAIESRGLDESLIQSIPIFQFKKGGERSFCECAVCLNEFQEEEKLRIIPNCSHVFHIDCIDVWLQSNANCPLCRRSVSITSPFPTNQIITPRSSPQDPNPFIGSDEDFVVIELQETNSADQSLLRRQERLNNSGESPALSISPSLRKLEQRSNVQKKGRKFHHVSSMGDECIDTREKDDQFSIQPLRRSFSMDSSSDRQLYLSIQAIVQQNRHVDDVSTSEGCSSRVRRTFFSFGHGRGSRSAVPPIHLEP